MVIIVGGVGSQPALGAGLTAVLGFVEPLNSHGICLKELLNDVTIGVVDPIQISPSKRGEIAHSINEKLHVGDVEFLFQLLYELFSGMAASVPRESCVEHDVRIHVNCSVEPRFLLIFELNLCFIDSNTVWFSGEVLLVVVGVGLILVMDRGSASFDAEPLTEISTFG